MSIWHIYGGNRLTGSTRVQGAKNAVLPIMAASVLSGGETVLHNVPDLRDVTTTLRILQHLGCTAVRDGDTVRIDSRGMHCDFIPHALMRELRSSVIFLGAILARFGTARLSMPGGCELGPRPVNLHLDALRALGAEVTERGGDIICRAHALQGLPIMAASVLSGGETVLHNVPDLRDVTTTLRILQHLGCTAVRDGDTVRIDSRGMHCDFIPHALMRELRSSVIFLGAILARFGTARLSMPGGCELGPRPVNLHLDALRALGAEVTERGGDIICRAHALQGRRILLPFPSVGATENAMLAACAAAGETVICNAAREPEIADLQCYLRKLGADISGAGTSTVTVGGFRPRPFVEHTIMPDRIVAATILCAAAACGGEVELQDVDPAHFSTVLDSLSEAGCAIITAASAVRLSSDGQLTAPRPVVTQPYPGFPTDAQPPLMAACLRAKGTTVFTENIFTNRYRHAEEFRRLGAAVSIEGRVAYVTGVERLTGAPLTASDLRGGAAMLVAGLCAEGATELFDDGYIDRGYDRFDACLSALGADVRCAAPR